MRRILLWAACVFMPATLWGQSQTGAATLSGIVTDPSSAAVSGAKITARQTETNTVRETESTGQGNYTFSSLLPGTYELIVEAQGFKAAKREGITLTVGASIALDVQLSIGAPEETITVTAEAPIVETTRSQTSTTVDSRSVSELPVNGRNFLDFAVLTPGVVKDPTRGGDLTFGGQRGTMNSLTVDGSDSNNVFFGQSTGRAGSGRSPYSFSQDAVQEFQVSTSAFAAEIGRAGAGVVNVITKSGTNQFHGTVFEFFRDKGLNANTFLNNSRRSPRGAYHYNQFGGNIGGPVVKDKLFFFFDYDGQRNSDSIATVLGGAPAPADAASQAAKTFLQKYVGQYPRQLNNDVFLVKGDWNISNSQRLSLRYNANRFSGVNFENGGAQIALEHTGNSDVTTDNFSGNHSWTISPTKVLESRLTWTRDNEPGQANSTDPEAIIRSGGTNVMSIGRNSFSPRYTNAKTLQWAEGLSWMRSSHTFKAGVDMIFQSIGNYFPGNFSGSYTFNSYADFTNKTPISYTQAFAGPNTDGALTKPNVNEYAFYLQDSWRVNNRLTLNYGIRYDFFDLAQPKVKNPDPMLASSKLDTSRINLDTNNWGPRFGFAYKATNSGKTVVRGGWGMYYGRTPSILTGTAMSQNGIQVQTYTITSNFPTYPNILSAPPALNRTPDIYVFAPDYVQPLTHQYSLNVEQALGNDYSLTIGYMGVRGEHLTRTRDINRFAPTPFTLNYSTGGTTQILRYNNPRPNAAFGRISLFDSGADSYYHGGFIQLGKRFSRNFQVQTSYTYSKVIDSKPDSTSVVVGTDDSKNPQDQLNPNLDRGRGNADITHKFVFSGIWNIDYARGLSNPVLRNLLRGYELSLISYVQSGRPVTATIGGDPNNDGNSSTDRPPGFDRNTLGTPAYLNADVRLTRDIAIKERIRVRLIFEAFNVTNRANFSAINTAAYTYTAAQALLTPTTNFMTKTGTTSDPRILQLAAKITF